MPTSNLNANNDNGAVLSVDATLTAYMETNSLRTTSATLTFSDAEINPVTDAVTTSEVITTDAPNGTDTLEDGTYNIDINLSTVDNPDFKYVQDASDDSVATTITFTHVSGIDGTLSWGGASAGSVDLSQGGTTIAVVPVDQIDNLTFKPLANKDGSVTLTYDVYTKENGATNIEKSEGSITFDVAAVADGLDTSSLDGDGTEFTDANTHKFTKIDIGTTMLDTVGTEVLKTLMIDDVPDGFLIYSGSSGSESIAQNAGDNGSGANTWNIPISGGVIPEVWIVAPENWSGTVSSLNLITYVDDNGSLQRVEETFDVTIDPVNTTITIDPTKTFAAANQWADININANMNDLDGSETMTLTLQGASTALDSTAQFRLSDGSTVNSSFDNGIWILTDIASDKINDIQILYHGYNGDVDVTAKTVDGSAVNDTTVTGLFRMEIEPATEPTLSINDITVNEDVGTATFTVIASNIYTSDITFDYSTSDDTASAGNDYTAKTSQTGTITAGQTSTTITIDITDDTLLESSETFNVILSNPTNATIADATGIATITDNDSATVTISATDANASETATDNGQFTVDLGKVNNTGLDIVVNYTVSGTATPTTDYTALSGNVTIANGEQSAIIDVNGIVDDATVDTGETVTVTLSSTNNGSVSVDTTPATVTITDNDFALNIVPTDSNAGATGENTISEDAGATTVTGKFTVTAGAGIKSIAVDGNTITKAELDALGTTPKVITTDGESGTLTLSAFDSSNGEVTYSYVVSGIKNHTNGEVVDSISLTVTDDNDTTSNADSLDILITDTTPTANADTLSVTEDAADAAGKDDSNAGTTIIAGNFVTGTNATADTIGADSTTVTGVATGTDTSSELTTNVNTDVTGTYGKINIAADGSYTYTLDNTNATVNALNTGSTLIDNFVYTIKDADGDYSTTTVSVTINGATDVTANTAPILDLDSNDSTTSSGSKDYNTSYALGKTAISISDSDTNIIDSDDTNIESATITLTNKQTNDVLFAGDLPSGITASSYDSSTGVITLSGSASLSDYEKAIEAIKFYNGTTTSDTTTRTISVVVNDGDANSNTATTTIEVATNALSVRASESVEEGKSAIFIVELNEARSIDTKFYLSTSGDATSGSDYYSFGDATYSLQYFDASDAIWKNVSSDGSGYYVTIPNGSTRVDVKIKTIDDGIGDNGESLVLKATVNGDSTGLANSEASASTILTEFPSLTVSAPNSIVEGQFGIFEVALTSTKSTTTDINLTIGGDVTTSDYNTTLQYSTDEGTTWSDVTGAITMAANTSIPPSIMVKVTTLSDGSADDNESLVLSATTTDANIATKSASDFTTVVEPLTLSATEQKDESSDVNYIASVDATATAPAGYKYIVNGNGENGTVTQSGDNLIYTPDSDFSGEDSFSFIKVDTATGERTASTANVTVVAKADTPIVSITANVAAVENVVDPSAWKSGTAQGNPGNVSYTGDDTSVDTPLVSGNSTLAYMMQEFSATDGMEFDLSFITSGDSTDLEIYWATTAEVNGVKEVTQGDKIQLVTGSGTLVLDAVMNATGTTTIPNSSGYNTIMFVNADKKTTLNIDSLEFKPNVGSGNTLYDIAISNTLADTDGSESLQDVKLVFKDSSGVALDSSTYFSFDASKYDSSTKTWTLSQTDIQGLQATIPSAIPTSGFTVEVVATSQEGADTNNTASSSASVYIIDNDDRPTIGDSSMSVVNDAVNQNGSNIETDYSSNTANRFSWDPSKSTIPNLYVDSQIVQITYDSTNNVVKGTIDNGATTIFTTTIVMADNDATTINYTQADKLLGVQNSASGDIILPGGGNNDYRVFQFTKSDSDASVAVDALVTAHNLIEDSVADLSDNDAEHTVNTNNFYIGVDSNNMNAGQQLVFDFATTKTDAEVPITTDAGVPINKNDISAMDIKLFNFGSEKSGDELYITIHTISGKEEIRLTQDSDYTNELEYTITHSGGELINKIEFLAGNESSFKLGIQGVSYVNYDEEFEMKFAYDITDTDADGNHDSDGGVATVLVNSTDANAVVNISLVKNSDSTIVYDSTDEVLDAGGGVDTLILNSGGSIDFSSIPNNKIQNIESIDLSQNGDHTLSNITLDDILGITDSNNTIKIFGDSSDNVSLDSENSNNWTKGSTVTEDGHTFDIYTNSGDSGVVVKIEDHINDSII